MEVFFGRKVWTVNASDVEWVECEHISKTWTIIQLEAQIDHLRCTLDSLPKTNGTVTHQKVQSYLESLTSTLLAEMNDRKFKLEPESFSTKVSVKKYDTSTTNIDFWCKMKQIQPIPTMQLLATNYRVCQRMSLLLHHGQLHQCSETGSMLSYPMYKNYQVFTSSNLLTLINHLNHQTNLKNTSNMQKKKKQNLLTTTRKVAMYQIRWM